MTQELRVYIQGIGMTPFGRLKESLGELIRLASTEAMLEAKCDGVDGIFLGCMNCEEFCGEGNFSSTLSDLLGLTPAPAFRIETASSSGSSAFILACQAILSGAMETVLVVAGEKMTSVSTPRATKILAEVIDTSERAVGASMPALAALVTQRYMHDYGMTREALIQVALKNHHNGVRNPFAQFRKEITRKKILQSRIIADPLCLFDCCPISDGAAAAIISKKKGPCKIRGWGSGTDHVPLRNRSSYTSFQATTAAAKQAYNMADIRIPSKEIQFAEIHDAFTMFEIIGTEDTGLFEKGKGWKAVLDGKTAVDGELPVNASGGLKSRGHPVGASGLAQIAEIYAQMTDRPKGYQVPKADLAIAQSIGGLATNNTVVVLERT